MAVEDQGRPAGPGCRTARTWARSCAPGWTSTPPARAARRWMLSPRCCPRCGVRVLAKRPVTPISQRSPTGRSGPHDRVRTDEGHRPGTTDADHAALLGVQRADPAGLGRAARGRARGQVQLATRRRRASARPYGHGPDLVICPFLRERVPAEVWTHLADDRDPPGPEGRPRPVVAGLGDHGRRARLGGHRPAGGRGDGRRPDLGVPDLPGRPGRRARATLYNGPVTDAAVALVHEVVAKAADPVVRARAAGLHAARRPRDGCGPPVRQADRAFSWSDPTEHILRRIRAADGITRRAHPAVRGAGRGLRRPPRPGRPPREPPNPAR